jgi:hypothetical protein
MANSAFSPSVLTLPQMGVNKLINGSMAIDQRNSGASKTFTAGAALSYSIDRWYGYSTGANVTGQRIAGSAQTQYRYQFTGAASTTAIGFGQRIEAANCYDLNGRIATLSVDLANSLLTTVTWTAYYANTADTFGTLASPTRTQIATGSFTVSSSLARYTAQISIPTAATTGIEIVFTVGAQISGTWTIGNAQLEAGSSASNFEQRQTSYEFCSCQRYYQKFLASGVGSRFGTGFAASATDAQIFIPFLSLLRLNSTSLPLETTGTTTDYTISVQGSSLAVSVLPTTANTAGNGAVLTFTSSGMTSGDGIMLRAVNSSAYVAFNAEL